MNPTILGVIGPGFLNPVRTLYGSNKGCFESLLFRSFSVLVQLPRGLV